MTAAHYALRPDITHLDITAAAGDPFDLIVPVVDRHNQALALSSSAAASWEARATVRRNVHAADALHTWTTTGPTPNARINPGPAVTVQLLADPATTAGWTGWPGWVCGWDLDLLEPPTDGGPAVPHRIATGRFRLLPEYTR